MPTEVHIKGIDGPVFFPDNMSHAEIDAAIKNEIIPAHAPSYWDTFKNAVPKGTAGLVDSVLNVGPNVYNLGKMGVGAALTAMGHVDKAPDITPPRTLANEAGRGLGLIKDSAEPVDLPGRFVDMAGQVFGGGGLNPAAIARSAAKNMARPIIRDVAAASASSVGAATGQEIARNADFGSDGANAMAQALLTFGGGAAAGGAVSARGTAGDRAAAAINGVTPQQIAAAKVTMEKATAAGAPITPYEAIQSVTGMNPKMQTQQRVAEQSDAAAHSLTPMMQGRPAANTALFNNVADKIAPANPLPDTLAGRLQNAASQAIEKAQEARSAEAGPFYGKQRQSDAEAMGLQETIPALESTVQNRLQARDGAVNISGQLHGLQNDMTQAARDYHPVPGYPGFPARYLPHTDVAKQAGQGRQEALTVAKQHLSDAAEAEARMHAASDALAEKNLPEIQSKVQSLLANLDQQIKVLGPTVEGKHLQAFRNELAPNGEPIVYPSQLESVYRNNRNKLETGPFSTSTERTQAGILGPQVQALKSLVNDVSPLIAEGRQKYADASKAVVEPLKLGQVGKLARSDDFGQQTNTLLPETPRDVTPQVIDRTARTIGEQDPDILRQVLAQHLRGQFNEANQANIAGPNVFGGSKFAAKIAGNPGQADNLNAAVTASGGDAKALADALEVFRAQGMKPAVNSATAANLNETTLLGGQKLTDVVMRPWRAIPGAVDSWRNGWSTKALAEALASPTGLETIQELARMNGAYSPTKQQVLANILRATPESSPTQ